MLTYPIKAVYAFTREAGSVLSGNLRLHSFFAIIDEQVTGTMPGYVISEREASPESPPVQARMVAISRPLATSPLKGFDEPVDLTPSLPTIVNAVGLTDRPLTHTKDSDPRKVYLCPVTFF